MHDEVFYHDGSEFAEGWYIHTPQGGVGPFESEEMALETFKVHQEIAAKAKDEVVNGD